MTNTTSAAANDHPTVPERLRDAITDIVNYLWESEYEDYDSFARSDHIFVSLCIVRDWLSEEHLRSPSAAVSDPAESPT